MSIKQLLNVHFLKPSKLNKKNMKDDTCSQYYISPQKNRAVKNKYYFYSYYGKEETYHIKNQG